MSATVMDCPVDLDDVLYQSVVDETFRSELLADPAAFGLDDPRVVIPAAVEPQDRSLLSLAAGSVYMAQCRSTCSSGPLTIICDGTTK